jgi:DNA-binding transcriptional MerR regulator
MTKYVKISDVSKILNLIDPKTKKPQNHTLRYWEKNFNEIAPKKINNQRYYSLEQVEKLKIIKYLLKREGMTISGVKNILKSNANKLDVNNNMSLKTKYFKEKLKFKSKNLLNKINKIRKNGKKNSSKSSNGS